MWLFAVDTTISRTITLFSWFKCHTASFVKPSENTSFSHVNLTSHVILIFQNTKESFKTWVVETKFLKISLQWLLWKMQLWNTSKISISKLFLYFWTEIRDRRYMRGYDRWEKQHRLSLNLWFFLFCFFVSYLTGMKCLNLESYFFLDLNAKLA